MSEFMINNGYAVVLTEDGKNYVQQSIRLNLENIEMTSSQIIDQAKTELLNFIAKQEAIAAEIEAALPEGVTLKDIFNTRVTNGAVIFDDTVNDLKKTTEEYESAKERLQRTAGNYYNVLHKTITDFTRILYSSNGKNAALANLQSKIEALDTQIGSLEAQERQLLQSLTQYTELEPKISAVKKEFEQVWHTIKKNPPIDIQIGVNGNIQVTCPKRSTNITNAIRSLLGSIDELDISSQSELKRFMYNINNRAKSGDSPARKARRAYEKLKTNYSKYLGDGEATAYTDRKAREAIHELLQNFIASAGDSASEVSLQLYTDVSRGDRTRRQATSAEFTIATNSQQQLASLIPEMTVEAIHNGGKATRSVMANINGLMSDFSKEKMSHSGIDVDDLRREQANAKLFKEFGELTVQDKVDDYLVLTSPSNQNKYIIAFSDKLYSAYSSSKYGLENLNIVGSDGANLLSSLDLIMSAGDYSFSDNIKNSLLFTMLNMSTASIYYSNAQQYKETIINFIKQLLAMYFSEMAFNTSNFTKQLPSETSTNSILYVTQANNMIVPLSTTLKGIVRQMEDKDKIEEMIKVQIQTDTAHDPTSLYNAALQRFPVEGNNDPNKAWRWNYVAQQVAHNTLINISYNIMALAQYYNF